MKLGGQCSLRNKQEPGIFKLIITTVKTVIINEVMHRSNVNADQSSECVLL